jgi:arylsulfatase A-like enzyme
MEHGRHGRQVILPIAFALLSVVGCAPEPAAPPSLVVLVTIDTLRADHLGSYGYPRGVSPFLDGLAEDSLVFEHALSASSHTAPSHAALFTSLYPAQHRLLRNGELLADGLITLAEVFREQGYETAGFTPVKFLNGLSQGFDHFRSGEVYAPAEEVFGWAREWLESRGPERRVFVWIHLFDVHEWYQDHHVDHDAVALVERSAELQGGELVEFLEREHGLDASRFPGRRGPVVTMNLYDAQLLRVDRELEGFFRWTRERGLYSGSLWIITSDHGEGLGNHRFLGHGRYIYNEQLRVPLLIHSGDGSFAPRRIAGRVQLVDLAPTLAEIIGGSFSEQPIPIVGQSLVGLMENPGSEWQPVAAFAQRRPVDQRRLDEGWIPGEVFAFQDGRRKIILKTEGAAEVYDLAQDPFEHFNLADDSDQRQQRLAEELTERFRRMLRQGEVIGEGEIQPEFVEELRALGYL